MSSRTRYLVCYDISCTRTLARVHRYLLGFRIGGQKSFFECWLTPAELRDVSGTLNDWLDPQTDRAHIFELDPRRIVSYLGCASAATPDVLILV